MPSRAVPLRGRCVLATSTSCGIRQYKTLNIVWTQVITTHHGSPEKHGTIYTYHLISMPPTAHHSTAMQASRTMAEPIKPDRVRPLKLVGK